MRELTLLLIIGGWASGSLAATVQETIAACSDGRDHYAMAKCIEDRAAQASARLQSIDRRIQAALQEKSDESPSIVAERRASYAASVAAYAAYRKEQCRFQAALTAMSVYQGEFTRACEAQMDAERADLLERGRWWLD